MTGGIIDSGISLTNLILQQGSILDLTSTGLLTQTISGVVISASCNVNQDLSGAGFIFTAMTKTIIKNEAGTLKLTYYDLSDIFTVVNVNA